MNRLRQATCARFSVSLLVMLSCVVHASLPCTRLILWVRPLVDIRNRISGTRSISSADYTVNMKASEVFRRTHIARIITNAGVVVYAYLHICKYMLLRCRLVLSSRDSDCRHLTYEADGWQHWGHGIGLHAPVRTPGSTPRPTAAAGISRSD